MSRFEFGHLFVLVNFHHRNCFFFFFFWERHKKLVCVCNKEIMLSMMSLAMPEHYKIGSGLITCNV